MDENTTTSGDGPQSADTGSVDSILGGLKARREELVENATLDLPVPRWSDPEILVRFKPVAHGAIRRGQDLVNKAPAAEKHALEVEVNSDVLIRGCVGVFARIDGKEYSLRQGDRDGDWTRFDKELADALGVETPNPTARQVVKALYLFDGDVISTAGAVITFSGYKEAEADSKLEGE